MAFGFCVSCLILTKLTKLTDTMEDSKLTQRAEISLLRIQGWSVSEAHQELLRIHGQSALSLSTVHRWFCKFDHGVQDFSVKKTGGQISKVTPEVVNKVKELLAEDNTMCLRVISNRTGLSLRTIHHIIRNKLELKKRPAKWIPHALSDAQKRTRLRMARGLLTRFCCTPSLHDRVITGDESWFFCYELETKRSTSAWLSKNEDRPPKPVRDRYVRKVMLIIFWDSQGVVHREFVPDGKGVNAQVYLQTMRQLREKIRRHRLPFWCRQNFWLHHDGAPAHHSALVTNFLQATGTNLLPHPPYSPDLAPSDFFLFARMKRNMRGEVFASVEDLIKRVDFEIGQVAHWEFQHTLRESWLKRLEKCVEKRGNYFES